MPRSPVITDLAPEQSIQRRLAESEEAQRNRTRVSSGAPGAAGAEGPTGPEGRGPVGLHYKFSTSTTSSDPGAGFFRFNKNIISESPTQMYISETDLDGGFAALYMVKWGVSTSTTKGYIIMRKRGAPLTWALFSIQKQYTDNGTWDTFPELTKIAGEGTWNNNDEFYIDSIFVGDKGEKGETGAGGAKGETGASGATGPAGGYNYKFLTNVEATNPGNKFLKYNNATPASVTKINLSETELGGGNIAAAIQEWDDSTTTGSRALIVLRSTVKPENFAVYKVIGAVVDNGEWDTVPVSFVASNGTFSNEEQVNVIAVRTGDKGEKGEKGETGTAGSTGGTGPAGPTGSPQGIKLKFLTNTEETEPGSGAVKFNKTTISEVTRMFISEKEFAGNSIQQVLETLVTGNETIRSYLMFMQENDPTKWAMFFCIATREDKGEWEKFEIGYVAGPAGFENEKPIRMEFIKTGLKGEKGEKGAEGASGSTAYFRDVWTREGAIPGGTAAATYIIGNTALIVKGANSAVFGGIKFIDPTGDYPVTEKQARFRLKGEFATNATGVGLGKMRFSLRKVTAVAGATGGITYTLGEPVLTTPFSEVQGASTQKLLTSVEAIKLAEAAMYVMCIELETAAIAAASFVAATCTLQVQNT